MENEQLVALLDEKKSVKNEIQNWIAAFLSDHGRQPYKEEKAAAIKHLYERYRALQQTIQQAANRPSEAALTARELSPSHTRRLPTTELLEQPNSAREATANPPSTGESKSGNWIPSLFGGGDDSSKVDQLEEKNDQLQIQLEEMEARYAALEESSEQSAQSVTSSKQEAEAAAAVVSELHAEILQHVEAAEQHAAALLELQNTNEQLSSKLAAFSESQAVAQLAIVNEELGQSQRMMLEARAEAKAARESLKIRSAELAAAVESGNNYELTAAQLQDSLLSKQEGADTAKRALEESLSIEQGALELLRGELQVEKDSKAALVQQCIAQASQIELLETAASANAKQAEAAQQLSNEDLQQPGAPIQTCASGPESAQMRRRISNLEYALNKAIQWNRVAGRAQ